MSRKTEQARFTKVTSRLLLDVRDLAKWGFDTGNTTPEALKASVLQHDPVLRRKAAIKMIESGMSQRQVAKVLAVDESTVRADLRGNPAQSAGKSRTGSAPDPLEQAHKRELALKEQLRIALSPTTTLTKQYGTVVIDPPWPMKKIEREVRPNQVEFDYPTLDYEQLRAFRPVFQQLTAPDCHVFMWTTHRFLPMALRLFEDYGVKYVFTMVWHKPGGFQPVGLPQYNCEFALYGRIGSPTFSETTAFDCCFEAPRREHSRKPDEFYDLLRRVTVDGRVDVFSRELREGFDQFGNEPNKFVEAAE